jgi:death-on-curing protein
MTRFLTVDEVVEIHNQVIQAAGGLPGIRDLGLLDSAVHRPQSGFGGTLFYPGLPEQGAALVHSLAANHPFVDGNKRVAFTAMDVFFRTNSVYLAATEDAKYEFMIAVATKQLDFSQIVAWISSHIGPASPS